MSKPLLAHDYYTHFLEELRAARAQSGVTQTRLAELLGEDQAFVSKCERGVRRLDVVELKRWTEALGIPLARFVEQFSARIDQARALSKLSPHKARKRERARPASD
jgi:transcriptional regulator with XRE-family HTH domain